MASTRAVTIQKRLLSNRQKKSKRHLPLALGPLMTILPSFASYFRASPEAWCSEVAS